jgi:methylthioribose-1-phosphate isomerase
MLPTIKWEAGLVKILDQRKLPSKVEWYTCRNYREVIKAIEKMVIRGAPAIGVAAALGLALGASSIRARSFSAFRARFVSLAEKMRLARPTAINLQWAIDRMLRLADRLADQPLAEIKQALQKESEAILTQDIEINRNIGRHGSELVPENSTILTHCNAGSLATAGYGTALGVIRAAHEAGKGISVVADETRPWLQGLRLTSFELLEDGIPVTVIADNAAGSLMRQGKINLVITGADRIAANGDVANKIGTYQVALMAKAHRIPFYVAAPISTIDAAAPDGEAIPVEQRPLEEISRIGGVDLAPPGTHILNPAFDITPAKYVTAIITEVGIIRPPYKRNLRQILNRGRQFSS